MKLQLSFGAAPVCIPAIPSETIQQADAAALRLLCALASGHIAGEMSEQALCACLGVSAEALASALAFWQDKGCLTVTGLAASEKPAAPGAAASEAPAPAETKKPVPKKTKVSEIPIYTDSEFTDIMESRCESLGDLITEAQNAFGKVFNLAETKILVSLVDSFHFEPEYMLIILAFCNRIDKRNMRYVEKLAASLYDQQIESAADLTEYLRIREEAHTLEGKVRSTFGLGARAITAKEKTILDAWNEKYHFSWPLIEKAYELTVSSINKPSVSYANSILERWYSEGITTPEGVDAARAAAAGTKGAAGMSFDVDQFFRAAVERSYSDDPTQTKE